MSKPKMQHCFNCGAELGVYEAYYGDLQNCGASECTKAESETHQAEREEAHRDLDDRMNDGCW